jgi:hypothetical protein
MPNSPFLKRFAKSSKFTSLNLIICIRYFNLKNIFYKKFYTYLSEQNITYQAIRLRKTFISKTLQEKGVNAYDADMIEGLYAWVDKAGKGFAN